MATYEFKTEEDIDDWTRTIIKTVDVPLVPATTREEAFQLINKKNKLDSLKVQRDALNVRIGELEAEIAEAQVALDIEDIVEGIEPN